MSTYRCRLLTLAGLCSILLLGSGYASMGCGGSTGDSGTTGGTTGTTGTTDPGSASAKSLSTVPSADISNLDVSQDTSSSSASVSKVIGGDQGTVGEPSRAGCEFKMHKDEMIRMAKMVQEPRCRLETLVEAGVITEPNESTLLLQVNMIKPTAEELAQWCDGIPEDRTEEKASCQAGTDMPDKLLVRYGITAAEGIKIDICEDGTLVDESTYTASGSIYTVNTVHIDNWEGKTERGSFAMSVDLGTTGLVKNGDVTLGDGNATATGVFSGGYGSGTMTFTAGGSDTSVSVKGAFKGGFTDPVSDLATSFTGKVYAKAVKASSGAISGCAKFNMSGSMPPLRAADMIPVAIAGTDQADEFYGMMSMELGVTVTATNAATLLFCPNTSENFDPSNVNGGGLPLVPLDSGETSCPSVTETGVECFTVTNLAITEDFGTKISQRFTIADPSTVSSYSEVNAFDVAALSADVTTPAFSRNFDCTGTPDVTLAEEDAGLALTEAQIAILIAGMKECDEIVEDLRNNEGMGGYNCAYAEETDDIKDLTSVRSDERSLFEGEYTLSSQGNCTGNHVVQKFFVKLVDKTTNRFCVATDNGICDHFTVNQENDGIPVGSNVRLNQATGVNIVNLSYQQNGVDVSITSQSGSCTATYRISDPGRSYDGRNLSFPAACGAAGITEEAKCQQFCEDSIDC